MQKLILDTNVVVSALISNSLPTKILYDVVLTREVEICLSDAVFAEYIEVLGREKFSRFLNFKAKAAIVLNTLKEISTLYEITTTIEILKDTSDNKFLELVAASSADYLITGNTLDFTLTKFESASIVTPRQYWDNHT